MPGKQERLTLYDLREQIGLLMPRPSAQDAQQWADSYYQTYRQQAIDTIPGVNRPREKKALMAEIRRLHKLFPELFPYDVLAHTTMTAIAIIASKWQQTRELAMQGMQSLNATRIREGVILADVAYGQEQVLSAVVRGEDAKAGMAHRTAIDALTAVRKPAKIEASGVGKLMQRYNNFALLLDEAHDPTGFLLVDEIVKNLSGQPSQIIGEPYINKYQVPQFVVAGAKMASDHYKALYPVVVEAVPIL